MVCEIRSVVIYARTAAGGERAVEDQIAACREVARDKGWSVVGEYADVDTSESGVRHGFLRMLVDVRTLIPVDAVLVYDLARLRRSYDQFLSSLDALHEVGLAFVTVV